MNVQSKNKLVWNAVPTKFAVPKPTTQLFVQEKSPCSQSAPTTQEEEEGVFTPTGWPNWCRKSMMAS